MAASVIFAIASSAATTFGLGGLVTASGGFAAGSLAASIFGQSAFAAFAVRAAVGIALGQLNRPGSQDPRGYQVAVKGAALPHQIIYGRALARPARLFTTTSGLDNDRMHRILAYAGHEIEDYETFYINGQKVTKWKNIATSATDITDLSTIADNVPIAPQEVADVDEDGNIVSGTESTRYISEDGNVHYIRMFMHRGSPDQTADSELVADTAGSYAEWTSEHRLRGIAYIHAKYQYEANGDVFPSGPPTIFAVIKGRKLFDPREVGHDSSDPTTWAWSDNTQLCIADYLTEFLDEEWTSIDQTLLAAQADVCDQSPTYGDGGARFTCNGAFTTDATPQSILVGLRSAMAGSVWYAQGNWRMRSGSYTAPTMTLTDADLRSEVSLQTRASRRDNFNVLAGTFAGDETNWQVTDYPKVQNVTDAVDIVSGSPYTITASGSTDFTLIGAANNTVGTTFVATGAGTGTGTVDAFLGVDNGLENALDLGLPFTDNSIEARRIGRIVLERNRQQLSVGAAFSMKALKLQVSDTVNLTIGQFGWDTKPFEVVGFGFGIGEDNTLAIRLDLQEISASVFDEVDDGVVYERDNTSLPNAFTTSDTTFSNISVQLLGRPGGTFDPVVTAQWAEGNIGFIREYVFQWRENTVDYPADGGMVVLDSSATQRQQDIYYQYLNTLYRIPDQDGFDTYDGGGLTITQIRAALIASPEFASQGVFNSFVGNTTNGELRGLNLDSRYDLRIMTRNYFNQVGQIDTTTIEVNEDTDAPPVPTYSGVSNSVIGLQVTYRWVNPTLDGSGNPVYDREFTEVWRSASAALTLDGAGDPTNATKLGDVASPAAEFIDTAAAASTTYYYYARAVDFSGNKSAFAAGVASTTDAALTDGVTLTLTPSSVVVPTDENNQNGVYTNAIGYVKVYEGDTDVTSSYTLAFSSRSSTGVSYTINNASKFIQITAINSALTSGWVQCTLTRTGYATLNVRLSAATAVGGATGVAGVPGLIISMTRPAAIVSVDASGTPDYTATDNTISVTEGTTAYTYDTTPDVSEFEVSAISVTAGSMTIDSSLANAAFGDHSSMTGDTATVRYTVEGKDSNTDSWGPVYVFQQVRKVYDGATGDVGPGGITAVLSNEAHLVPADTDGGNPVLTGSGTTLQVYEGGTLLAHNGAGTTPSTYKVVETASGITADLIPSGTTTLTYTDATAMSADTATVTYAITGENSDGVSFSITKIATFAKSKVGVDGTAAKLLRVEADGQVFTYDGDGAQSPASQSIVFTASVQGTDDVASAVSWSANPAVTGISGTGATKTLTWANFDAAGVTAVTVTASADSGAVTDSITVYKVQDGATPADAFQKAVVSLFRTLIRGDVDLRPNTPTGDTTYTFATGAVALPGTTNGWSAVLPTADVGEDIWVIQASAVSQSATDIIPDTEWSSPTRLSGTGLDGINTSTIFLYDVSTSAGSPPTDVTGGTATYTYTFATDTLAAGTGNLQGWTRTAPSLAEGDYLWLIQATASSNEATDEILGSEFSAPALIAKNVKGDTGNDGDRTYTGTVYYTALQATSPGLPSETSVTFNETTGNFSGGTFGATPGWRHTQPDVDATDTTVFEWSCQFIVDVEGTVTFPDTAVANTRFNFSNVASAIQISTNIASDNFDGTFDGSGGFSTEGTEGWAITRDGGNSIFNNITARGTMRSAVYTAGSAGWEINTDGSAEFNNGVFRGELVVVDLTVTGAFDAADIISENTSIDRAHNFLTGGTKNGNGGYQEVCSITTSNAVSAKPVEIDWLFEHAYPDGSGPQWGYKITYNHSAISETTLVSRTGMQSVVDFPGGWYNIAFPAPTGTTMTWKLYWWATDNASNPDITCTNAQLRIRTFNAV